LVFRNGTQLALLFLPEFLPKVLEKRMQSEIIAMLVPEHSLSATMLVRRADGRFVFERIDARVAAASRVAANWFRKSPTVEPGSAERTTARRMRCRPII
jgi:hypothetical protein